VSQSLITTDTFRMYYSSYKCTSWTFLLPYYPASAGGD